jgi:hypothetical protein
MVIWMKKSSWSNLKVFKLLELSPKFADFLKVFMAFIKASCAWNIKFNNFLLHYNLQPSFANPCVYTEIIIPKLILAIFVSVDLFFMFILKSSLFTT